MFLHTKQFSYPPTQQKVISIIRKWKFWVNTSLYRRINKTSLKYVFFQKFILKRELQNFFNFLNVRAIKTLKILLI